MNEELQQLHLKAGKWCGIKKTCGKKVKHLTYEKAKYIADKLNYTNPGQMKEAYPCPFCGAWHVGREMRREELEELANRYTKQM